MPSALSFMEMAIVCAHSPPALIRRPPATPTSSAWVGSRSSSVVDSCRCIFFRVSSLRLRRGDRAPQRRRLSIAFSTSEVKSRRKCSPYLESGFLSNTNDLVVHDWKTVPDIWRSSSEKYGDHVAVVDSYHDPPSKLTYKQLEQEIVNFSEGLRVVGVEPDEKLALFADNSCRWLVADQGVMATGAINVVRGTRSSNEELLQIYKHSESVALIVDNPQILDRLAKAVIPTINVKFVLLLWGKKSNKQVLKDIPLYSYNEIIELGQESRKALLKSPKAWKHHYEAIKTDDVATLMYTSGTSGIPKGVMLTHRNLLHQIKNLWEFVPAEAGDRFLSMLPTWHAYERASEYFIFTCGIEQMYTNVKSLKDDLLHYQPQYFISVPLVFETLYSSIQKQISLGSAFRKLFVLTLIKISMLYMDARRVYKGEALTEKQHQPSLAVALIDWLWARAVAAFLWPLHMLAEKLVYSKIHHAIGITKAGISGGAGLPTYVDRFFEAIGVMIQNGYGLTETSPVIAARPPSCNVLGTVGLPMRLTEIKITDLESGEVLPDGSKGIIKAKGPQVMKGYYKNPADTKDALDEEGWFSTGDIGWIVPKHSIGRSRKCGGMIVIEGRAKDTIVLKTGENVEPTELEVAAMRSSLIQQIVVIGQDQRRLGALIVPNKDELYALSTSNENSELSKEKTKALVYNELKAWTKGFTHQIGPILILDEPLTIENGLMTPTMKVQRNKVIDRYCEQIKKLYE